MAGIEKWLYQCGLAGFHHTYQGPEGTASLSPRTLSIRPAETVPQEGQNRKIVGPRYKPIHTSLLCQPFLASGRMECMWNTHVQAQALFQSRSLRDHFDLIRDVHLDSMLYTLRRRVNVSRFLAAQPEITCDVSLCHFCGCEALTLLTLMSSRAITSVLSNARTIGYNV